MNNLFTKIGITSYGPKPSNPFYTVKAKGRTWCVSRKHWMMPAEWGWRATPYDDKEDAPPLSEPPYETNETVHGDTLLDIAYGLDLIEEPEASSVPVIRRAEYKGGSYYVDGKLVPVPCGRSRTKGGA